MLRRGTRRGVPRWSGPARQVPSTRPAGCRNRFPELAEATTREQMSYPGFLAELLMAECDGRARRRSERRIKAAQFPRDKSLRAFDANPGVDPAVIHTLAACEWVTKSRTLCLIGDSGTGESRPLIALGAEAAMKGCRVECTPATKLVNELVEAADDKQPAKAIARYGRVDPLCIDELGSMELDRRGAELLFQVLAEREERNGPAIASNGAHMFAWTCARWRRNLTGPLGRPLVEARLPYRLSMAMFIDTIEKRYALEAA
ncbi:ATP-binding protein [Streptosporangium canum]|uniref:ATP-binding protein n=1 Tax=Streptosporangium canum TaxID=324952 RepID=UPI0037A7B3B0